MVKISISSILHGGPEDETGRMVSKAPGDFMAVTKEFFKDTVYVNI